MRYYKLQIHDTKLCRYFECISDESARLKAEEFMKTLPSVERATLSCLRVSLNDERYFNRLVREYVSEPN